MESLEEHDLVLVLVADTGQNALVEEEIGEPAVRRHLRHPVPVRLPVERIRQDVGAEPLQLKVDDAGPLDFDCGSRTTDGVVAGGLEQQADRTRAVPPSLAAPTIVDHRRSDPLAVTDLEPTAHAKPDMDADTRAHVDEEVLA